MISYTIIIAVLILVWFLCSLFSKPSSKLYILDKPNERSLHDVPKPRSGGIAIFFIVLVAWLSIVLTRDVENFIYNFLVGLVFLLLISYLDDKYSIAQIWRLLTHVLVASLLVFGGIGLTANFHLVQSNASLNLLINLFTVLFVVWCINLYNFMDGIDGLAGGMGVIGFICLAWFGWHSNNELFLLLASIIAAANLGFLLHNFPPAKIFMGDVGSIGMGYLVAFFSLWGVSENIFVWWVPILIFSPFFVDATVTVTKRLFAGEKVWHAHKSHNYQKLVRMGWGHRSTVIFSYILMIAAACSVILMQLIDSQELNYFLLLIWVCVYAMIVFLVSHSFSRAGKVD